MKATITVDPEVTATYEALASKDGQSMTYHFDYALRIYPLIMAMDSDDKDTVLHLLKKVSGFYEHHD